VPSMCDVVHYSSYSFVFRPKWTSSGVQVVVAKDSDAHCARCPVRAKHVVSNKGIRRKNRERRCI
jgi:hypothetical protein